MTAPLFPDWKEHHPFRLTPCSRAQTGIFRALSGETACASTKGWHRNFRHARRSYHCPRLSRLFTSVHSSTYRNIFAKHKWMAQVKCLLLHEFSGPFLLGVHALSEGICHFLTCVLVTETQTLPHQAGLFLRAESLCDLLKDPPPWHSEHTWQADLHIPVC